MTRVSASRNKARGKQDERDVARILQGRRHLADTGGPEDVAHEWLAVQVKGGKTVVTSIMRAGLDSARKAAEGTDKLPALVMVDRSGTRVQRWIAFPLEQWAEREGLLCAYCDNRTCCADCRTCRSLEHEVPGCCPVSCGCSYPAAA